MGTFTPNLALWPCSAAATGREEGAGVVRELKALRFCVCERRSLTVHSRVCQNSIEKVFKCTGGRVWLEKHLAAPVAHASLDHE